MSKMVLSDIGISNSLFLSLHAELFVGSTDINNTKLRVSFRNIFVGPTYLLRLSGSRVPILNTPGLLFIVYLFLAMIYLLHSPYC